jgi:hypothetical protein
MRRRWRSTFTPHSLTSFETAEAAQEDDPVLHCVGEKVQALAGSLLHRFSADELRVLVREVQEARPLDQGRHAEGES